MMDCINRQQLLEKAKEHQKSPFGIPLILAEIENAPTVDGEEVRYGEWIYNIAGWQCSECKYGVECRNNTPYCPKCGVKMKGGAE